MTLNDLKVWASVAILFAAVGCGQQTTTQPSTVASGAPTATSGSQSTAINSATSVTLTAPTLLTPTDGQQFKFTDQPLTLTLKNAVSTGTTPLAYAFQVATDAGFATIVYTKSGVPAGAGGQTSLKIDTLPGPLAKTYYWRAQTLSGSVAGPSAKSRSFSVGAQFTFQGPPVPSSPAQGSTFTGTGAISLTTNNAKSSGPAGQVTYKFDVADSSTFSHIIYTTTVNEQSNGQTTVSVNATLVSGTTYYWRVQATESTTGITSGLSTAFSFTFIAFSMSQATMVDNPPDLPSWAETAAITNVDMTGGQMIVDFDKRDGPDRWPDTPFGSGSLEYTLGMCLNINAHWYCSAVVQFWYGRELEAGGLTSEIGINWYYPPSWGPMDGYQPAQGELVGIFVAAGNLRHNTAGDNSYVKERSNVLLMPFGSAYVKK